MRFPGGALFLPRPNPIWKLIRDTVQLPKFPAGRGRGGVGLGWTGLDWVATKAESANRPYLLPRGPPGEVLPVNPSTLRVFKHLQNFDPSGYPSAGVSEPSGSISQSKAEEFAEVLGLRFALDLKQVRPARRALVHQSDFDEAADAGFPFGCGVCDFFDVTAFCAFEYAHDSADETAFAVVEIGPPVLSFCICCFHDAVPSAKHQIPNSKKIPRTKLQILLDW